MVGGRFGGVAWMQRQRRQAIVYTTQGCTPYVEGESYVLQEYKLEIDVATRLGKSVSWLGVGRVLRMRTSHTRPIRQHHAGPQSTFLCNYPFSVLFNTLSFISHKTSCFSSMHSAKACCELQ
jgi:hypothetical protein